MQVTTRAGLRLPILLMVGPILLMIVSLLLYVLANIALEASGASTIVITVVSTMILSIGGVGALAYIPCLIAGAVLFKRYRKAKHGLKSTSVQPSSHDQQSPLNNTGGWLFVHAITVGLILGNTISALTMYPEVFATLSSEDSEVNRNLASVVGYEVFYHVFIFILGVIVVAMITKKKKLAKVLAISFMSLLVIFGVIDIIWANSVIVTYNIDMSSAGKSDEILLGAYTLYAAIWIPYFLRSKRVNIVLIN